MKILWIPQISSKSKNDTILLTDDSNISVLMNMKDSIFFKENEITVALEFSRCNCVGIDWLEESGLEVWSDESRMFTNAKLERYNFNVHFYEKLKKQNYDIVFVNEPTKVLALKEIFVDSKIVTYNHWMACKNMKNLIIRQFEGMSAADICFLNSDYAKYEILSFYKKYEGVEKMNLIKFQPSFNMKVNLKKEAKYNIIYNHRLSTDPYYMKAFNSLIKVCDIVEKEIGIKNMPTVYFTNPSGKEFNVLSFKPYFAEITLEEKNDYNDFISSKEIGIHLNTFFESEGMWSMSTVDCAASGNICLLPRKYGYAEIFDKEYAGYCDTEIEMANTLISVLKRSKKEDWRDIAKDFDASSIKNHNGNIMGNKLQNMLKNCMEESGSICKRPWGYFIDCEYEKCRRRKILVVNNGQQLSLQYHKYRDEEWRIVKGSGVAIIGERKIIVKKGSLVKIQRGVVHSIAADKDSKLMIEELATSDIMVSESDIVRIEDKYGR